MSSSLLKLYILLTILVVAISLSLIHTRLVSDKNQNQSLTSKLLEKSSDFKNVATKETLHDLQEKVAPIVSPGVKIVTQALEETDYVKSEKNTNPCLTPTYYTLGAYDSRFAITKSAFEEEVIKAANVWNTASGKELFIYDKTGAKATLTVNLIYDYRQATTDKNSLLRNEIDNTTETAAQLEKEYKALEITFESKKAEYTKDAEAFTIRQKKYNDDVEYWNQKGGAPQDIYDTLTKEKEDLTAQAKLLDETHNSLKALLDTINTKIARYNELVAFANQNIDINNSTANKKFTEGSYSTLPSTISIFQFTDTVKLKRVLMHEFGHAIGLDHVEGKESIMYSINSGTSLLLSSFDKEALALACKQ